MANQNRKKLLKGLEEDKRRNFESNMRFIDLHVKWLKRTSNREWSRQQKKIIDGVYRRNRRLKLKVAR